MFTVASLFTLASLPPPNTSPVIRAPRTGAFLYVIFGIFPSPSLVTDKLLSNSSKFKLDVKNIENEIRRVLGDERFDEKKK